MDPTAIPIRDIRYPNELDWWPLAIGWWLVIIIVFLTAVFLGYKLYKRWLNNHARRIALRELKIIKDNFRLTNDAVVLLQELSTLLRRAILAYSPRNKMAGLVGEQWLIFLDQGLDEKFFSQGIGKQLTSVPYRNKDAFELKDMSALLNIVKLRIETPISQKDVN